MVRALRGRARIALMVSIACLGLLIAHNLYWGARNQLEGDRRIRYRVLPRDLAKASSRTYTSRGTQYAAYYWIDERVDADTLTVPPWLKSQRRIIQNATGLDVKVAREELLVRAEEEERLRADSRDRMRFLVDQKARTFADLYFVVDPGARKYVLAEGQGVAPRRRLYLLPAPRFTAVRGTVARREAP